MLLIVYQTVYHQTKQKCGRNVLARHLARYIRRRRKRPPKTAGETAQFIRDSPTRMRNLHLMTENPESAVAPAPGRSPRRLRSRSW